jgi:hypothetical protein
MSLTLAAIRTGHDPVAKLPEASFHTQLDQQIVCPKCDAAYNLIVDYTVSVGRFFAEESRPLIMRLRKAIFQGHFDGHRIIHFETNGVAVISHSVPQQEQPELAKPADLVRMPLRSRTVN